VPLPKDDLDHYLVAGREIDVPLNTSLRYAEAWNQGDEWRMGPTTTTI
jgi:hypothetical protein